MNLSALIFFRGLDSKSRLGIKRGGPLSDEERLSFIIALLRDTNRTLSSCHLFSEILVGTTDREGAEFVESQDLKAIVLEGYDTNSQLISVNKYFENRTEGYLIIACDLPFLTREYIENVVSVGTDLYKRNKKSIVFGVSRGLGTATVFIAPPNLFDIKLGEGPSLIVNSKRAKSHGIPFAVVFNISGYFDIDTLADLDEFVNLAPELNEFSINDSVDWVKKMDF